MLPEEEKLPVNVAKNYFLGKEGLKRLNCAQSVISAFKDKYSIDNETVELFELYGGGKAPEGMCGAYYAAKFALEQRSPEKLEEFEKYFIDLAGSVSCHQIRANKKLSCLGCVEKSAEFIKCV